MTTLYTAGDFTSTGPETLDDITTAMVDDFGATDLDVIHLNGGGIRIHYTAPATTDGPAERETLTLHPAG
jgi:hypothetical protein